MSWWIRTGAVKPLAELARRDPTIQKADASARRSLSAADIEADHDLLLSSMGGTRTANMRRGERGLALTEAASRFEKAQAEFQKADAEREAKALLVLPSEQRKREEHAAAVAKVTKATLDTDDLAGDAAKEEAEANLASAQKHLAQAKDTLRRLGVNVDDDDEGGAPPGVPVSDTKVKPGSANVTHKPNEEGVYAPEDKRTVVSTHHINRKMNRPGQGEKVQKSADLPGLNLAFPASFLFPNAVLAS